MSNVFIYAQGKGSRWIDSDTPIELPSEYKQLIPVGQEYLIQRTVRQFNQHRVIVFGKCDTFSHVFPDCADVWELKEPTGSIIDGFLTTAKYWKEDGISILVLGDVIFDNMIVQDLIDFSGKNVTIFGRMSGNEFIGKEAREIFAIALPNDEEKKQRFFIVMVNAINTFGKNRQNKKIWDLWSIIVDKGLTEYTFRDYTERSYTDDIDSPEGYKAFGKKLIQLALEDDKRFVLTGENHE